MNSPHEQLRVQNASQLLDKSGVVQQVGEGKTLRSYMSYIDSALDEHWLLCSAEFRSKTIA